MPEIFTNEDDGWRADFVCARCEESTEHWLYGEKRKVVRGDELRPDFFCVAEAGEGEAGAANHGHLRKAAIVVLPVAKIWIRNRTGAEVGFALVEHDELFGMRISNWIEQDGVDDGEERGIRADAESEREDGYDGEAGAFAKCSNGEAEILKQVVERAAAPLIASD